MSVSLSLFPGRANEMAMWQLSLKMGMAIYQKKNIQTVACHSQSSSAANSANRADTLQSSKLSSIPLTFHRPSG